MTDQYTHKKTPSNKDLHVDFIYHISQTDTAHGLFSKAC